MAFHRIEMPNGDVRIIIANKLSDVVGFINPKPKRKKSDYIYLCREETYGRNGNLRSLRKADMTPDVVRTYFWGFIRKYWRELLWIKN